MNKVILSILLAFSIFSVKAQSYAPADSCIVDSVFATVNAADNQCTISVGTSPRDMIYYDIALVTGFDPCQGETPEDGTFSFVVHTIMSTVYIDYDFGSYPAGYYAYAVRKYCNDSTISAWAYSNVVVHLMTMNYTLEIFGFDSVHPEMVTVSLEGGSCITPEYFQQSSTTGVIQFDSISKGIYKQTVTLQDSCSLSRTINLTGDTAAILYLHDMLFHPENVVVDPLTSIVTWSPPSDSAAHPVGYNIFLDSEFIASLPNSQFSYFLNCLTYNETHTVSIETMYNCGWVSDTVSYTFKSTFLTPAKGSFIEYEYGSDAVILNLQPANGCDSLPDFDGLLSFIIYRNDEVIGEASFENQTWTTFIDNSLIPNYYHYCVKTVYDLTAHGFPGETASSMSVCDSVKVAYGNSIPFEEDWSSGSFDTQQWTHDTFWVIDNSTREASPSASFQPTGLTNYSLALTSYYLNLDTVTLGSVELNFDLKLDDNSNSGTEKLTVQAGDFDNWHDVATFTNITEFDWQNKTVHITQEALGKVFRIRFLATGVNSNNLAAWYIDNISITNSCDAPILTFGFSDWRENTNNIYWQPPNNTISNWFHHDNGISDSSSILSLNNQFSVCTNINTFEILYDDLHINYNYNNLYIKKIRFWLNNTNFQSIVAKIWVIPYGGTGTILWSDSLSNVLPNQWNEVELDTPIFIHNTFNIYAGYTVLGNESGNCPVGMDTITINNFNYDLIDNGNGWEYSTLYTTHYWKIQAFLEGEDFVQGVYPANYIIYKDNCEDTGFHIIDTVMATPGQVFYHKYYPKTCHNYIEYFKVKALWTNDYENCLSDFGMDYFMNNDFIEIIWGGIEENNQSTNVTLYPNPAQRDIVLKSEEYIHSVLIYNALGQKIYEHNRLNNKMVQINTTNFRPGIYVVFIKAAKGITSKKLIVK